MKHYWQSPKGKAVRKRFDQTEKRKEYMKKWRQTPKAKAIQKKHEQSLKRKIFRKRSIAKRQRQLGFVPVIPNPFPQEVKIAWHHINKKLVFPMPRRLHEINIGQQHKAGCEKALENLGFELKHFEEDRS